MTVVMTPGAADTETALGLQPAAPTSLRNRSVELAVTGLLVVMMTILKSSALNLTL